MYGCPERINRNVGIDAGATPRGAYSLALVLDTCFTVRVVGDVESLSTTVVCLQAGRYLGGRNLTA